jgi:hypothetical protein
VRRAVCTNARSMGPRAVFLGSVPCNVGHGPGSWQASGRNRPTRSWIRKNSADPPHTEFLRIQLRSIEYGRLSQSSQICVMARA